MAIGMTYEEYWYGDPLMVRSYRKAEELRQERENSSLWLQGMYFYDAVSSALANAFRKKGSSAVASYPKEPYKANGQKNAPADNERQEDYETARARLYMQSMIRAGKSWGEK